MSMREVRRRPGGRSAQVRSAVLTATVESLAEGGYEAVSIADVAKRSGVHETSIYRRWGTRHRLVLEALVDHSAQLLQVPDTGTIQGDLVALGQQLVAYGTSPLGEALMRTLAANTDDAEAAATRTQFWAARLEECRSLVDRATERGEITASTDRRWLLELFIAPIHFRLLMTREVVDQPLLEALANAAVQGATPDSSTSNFVEPGVYVSATPPVVDPSLGGSVEHAS